MRPSNQANMPIIQFILYIVMFFSGLALVYHIRWFVPFLMNQTAAVVPEHEVPFVWFVVQICNNVVFLLIGIMLHKLFQKYQKSGYFDSSCLSVFDRIIFSCFVLAGLGFVQVLSNNIFELHLNEWTSVTAILNLAFRTFTRLLIFRDPQTMYLLLAMILWAMKKFAVNAIIVKQENESFI